MESLNPSSSRASLEFRAEIGVLPSRSTLQRHNALVISDGWPSLALALTGLGVEVKVYVPGDIVIHNIINSVTLDNVELLSNVTLTPNTTIWIQGGTEFINDVLSTLHNLQMNSNQLRCCIHPGTGRRSAIKSVMDSHQMKLHTTTHSKHGGITTGRWMIYIPRWMSGPIPTSSIKRSLLHVLDKTLTGICYGNSRGLMSSRGEQVTKRRRRDCIAYEENEQVMPGLLEFDVITSCVRQPYPHIKRKLSLEELLLVYDMQAGTIKDLQTASPTTQTLLLKYIVIALPEKVAVNLVNAILSFDNEVANPEEIEELMEGVIELPDVCQDDFEWMEYLQDHDDNDEKAARSDDAAIQTQQWDNYLVRSLNPQAAKTKILICNGMLTAQHHKLFKGLRYLSLRRYQRNVRRSFDRYMENKYSRFKYQVGCQLIKKYRHRPRVLLQLINNKLGNSSLAKTFIQEVNLGTKAIHKVYAATYWDWDAGSSLLYWRWPGQIMKEAKDGVPIHVSGTLPKYKVAQVWPKDKAHKDKMIQKWCKVIGREYVCQGSVVSLTGSFPVPKGKDDIRMVYDASKCGLNDSLWAPNFLLPTIDTALRQVPFKGWMGDIDLGEQFLNFPLDEFIRPYTGLDVTDIKPYIPKGILSDKQLQSTGRTFLRWERTLMGLKSSPFNACKMMGWALDVIRGDHKQPDNIFYWSDLRVNLPGTAEFNPTLPTCYKWDNIKQQFSPSFVIYVDDARTSGSTEHDCIGASRRLASICNHLGIQDAARKRRFPSQIPSVWCGAKSLTTSDGIYTSTTSEKWSKGQGIFKRIREEYESKGNWLNRKLLEKDRGFLIHLSRTYPGMIPFLKGIHHTLESWRFGRDHNGWKWSTPEWEVYLQDNKIKEDRGSYLKKKNRGSAPQLVKGVTRLMDDIMSLQHIFRSNSPPLRLVRSGKLTQPLYMFGDASGTGFGSMWNIDEKIYFRLGTWDKSSNSQSSNFREMKNLLDTLLSLVKENSLKGYSIFVFTDNSTAELAYYKGNSKSKLLHNMVTQLRAIELEERCSISIIHVSGERMKSQGTDGLSRGSLLEGSMKTQDMLAYIPLQYGCFDREGGVQLKNWVLEWSSDPECKTIVLEPHQWYTEGHDIIKFERPDNSYLSLPVYERGILIWTPPPPLAEVALEELRKARLKRTESSHIFLCPRLMTPKWKMHLFRAADMILEIPAGCSIWPASNHEPLIFAFFFPFLSFRPWQLRRTNAVIGMERHLQKLWKTGVEPQGSLLRQFWLQARKLECMQEGLVRNLLQSQQGFIVSG